GGGIADGLSTLHYQILRRIALPQSPTERTAPWELVTVALDMRPRAEQRAAVDPLGLLGPLSDEISVKWKPFHSSALIATAQNICGNSCCTCRLISRATRQTATSPIAPSWSSKSPACRSMPARSRISAFS